MTEQNAANMNPPKNSPKQSSLGKARHHGSAKSGVSHWIHQRLSAIALIGLGPWFLYSVLTESMTSYQGILNWLDNPGDLVLLVLTIVVGLYHGFLGLQVVIEDYVHTNWIKFPTLIILKFSFIVLGVMATYGAVSVKFLHNPHAEAYAIPMRNSAIEREKQSAETLQDSTSKDLNVSNLDTKQQEEINGRILTISTHKKKIIKDEKMLVPVIHHNPTVDMNQELVNSEETV